MTLVADPPRGTRPSVAEALGHYGLEPTPGLRLVLLPPNPMGSVLFRWEVVQAARAGTCFVARSKRYARAVLRRLRATVVLEVHEVDSRQAAERGEDPASMLALETEVLAGVAGVVANCPGTLALLRRTHGSLPPAVALHNATHGSRIRQPVGEGEGALYAGSIRGYKGLATLARAAALCRTPVTLLGTTRQEAARLVALSDGRLATRPPVASERVPDHLAGARVLLLPAASGLFGSHLTSPLKLWDYLAAGRAVVAADTPALRDAAGGAAAWYPPGDARALARTLDQVHESTELRRRLVSRARPRTWDERAAELEAFLLRVTG